MGRHLAQVTDHEGKASTQFPNQRLSSSPPISCLSLPWAEPKQKSESEETQPHTPQRPASWGMGRGHRAASGSGRPHCLLLTPLPAQRSSPRWVFPACAFPPRRLCQAASPAPPLSTCTSGKPVRPPNCHLFHEVSLGLPQN